MMRGLLLSLGLLLGLLPAVAGAHAPSHGDPRGALQAKQPALQAALRAATRPNPLPNRWCGQLQTQLAQPTDGQAFTVVYAHAPDQPSRYQQVAESLQYQLRLAQNVLLAQPGNDRVVRLRLGTACGPGYVQVLEMTLPLDLVYYQVMGTEVFYGLRKAVHNQWESLGIPRTDNVLLVADDVANDTGYAGQAEWTNDEHPDPQQNQAARGGLIAAIYARSGEPGGPSVLLHEMFHALGSVNNGAPHASGIGHCVDLYELMCYNDGTKKPMQDVCRSEDILLIDCGRDDYFNPLPGPGNYLAGAWNTYNSPFLCPVDTCLPPDQIAPAPPQLQARRLRGRRLRLRWPLQLGDDPASYSLLNGQRVLRSWSSEHFSGTQASVILGPLSPRARCQLSLVVSDYAGNQARSQPLRIRWGRGPGAPCR